MIIKDLRTADTTNHNLEIEYSRDTRGVPIGLLLISSLGYTIELSEREADLISDKSIFFDEIKEKAEEAFKKSLQRERKGNE